MPTQGASGKPTTRRYSEAEKERAVRAVRQLRKELGTDHGTIKRVADQIDVGVEPVWLAETATRSGIRFGRAAGHGRS